MKTLTKKLIIICLFGYGTAIQAQKAIPAAGGNCLSGNGCVSYTVGQLSYTINQGTNGNVAQGIQLPYEAMAIGIAEAEGINLVCSVNPNPTLNNPKLIIEDLKLKGLWNQMYDIRGKLLFSKKIDSGEMVLPMEGLEPAIYLLIVTQNQKALKTFKIIKN